jgi:palmitoyltransferase
MRSELWLVLVFVALLIQYTFICGNTTFHRNGFIGSLYRLITNTIPLRLSAFWAKVCPRCRDNGRCSWGGAPCRYLIFLSYIALYGFCSFAYCYRIYPFFYIIYRGEADVHRALTQIVLPLPWVMVLVLHLVDPGEITRTNVKSYLEIYPMDNVLYTSKVCPTLHIPVVPRSRFCKYTKRRIAKYDHYCPWVLCPIGARTHRWFVVFLIFNFMSICYSSMGMILYLRLLAIAAKVRLPSGIVRRIWFLMNFGMKVDKLVSSAASMIIGGGVMILLFLFQEMHNVGRNLSRIEIDKIEKWRKQNRKPYVHTYDTGFWRNWTEFLLPPTAAQHDPIELMDVGPNPADEDDPRPVETQTHRKSD